MVTMKTKAIGLLWVEVHFFERLNISNLKNKCVQRL